MKHLRRISVRLYQLFTNPKVEAELAREGKRNSCTSSIARRRFSDPDRLIILGDVTGRLTLRILEFECNPS